MKTITARLNYLHIAPRKVRAVANLIRGLPVQEAEAQLLMQRRRPRQPLLKVLRSAMANAKQQQAAFDRLVVASIRVDQGPMLKRWLPRALGRVTPLQKKSSHISLVLAEGDKSYPLRYTMVIPRKAKKKEVKKSAKPAAKPDEAQPKVEVKRPGFLQRIFRRKSV